MKNVLNYSLYWTKKYSVLLITHIEDARAPLRGRTGIIFGRTLP